MTGAVHFHERVRASDAPGVSAPSPIGLSADEFVALAQFAGSRKETRLIEFSEVKAAAERWKREKEEAERERDVERAQRESLSEMVEKLRAEAAERTAKVAKRNARRRQRSATKTGEEAHSHEDDDDASSDEAYDARANEPGHSAQNGDVVANGHLFSKVGSKPSSQRDMLLIATQPGQIVQAAPYLSAMSVVLLGAAVMALINKMQRGEH